MQCQSSLNLINQSREMRLAEISRVQCDIKVSTYRTAQKLPLVLFPLRQVSFLSRQFSFLLRHVSFLSRINETFSIVMVHVYITHKKLDMCNDCCSAFQINGTVQHKMCINCSLNRC